ncbi:golgin subfamily B member 1 [Xyrauchen texanus]|uniref:golgin subfamily B member 1 n=1 Tax=Xyrauchen texanus TaxID=154827 RepID=UPI002241A651|nr:golgin subfamily B member 1 [Xyrauchen texanus]XP_051976473.1 golgin subfamily B member 1 [Xyrauchen texanus]
MFSRLTQGVTSVLHELSGEERSDGDSQDGLVPQPQPDAEASLEGPGPSEEAVERLAQTEQLVVQLKELIRDKDIQLASTKRQLKEEKEQAEVKFTKLKLQAKAKMAALNKQISELKGQEVLNSSQNSESSFTMAPGVEEELQQLREKLSLAESSNKILQQQLWEAEQRIREEGHAEQVRVLQTVVKEKDVRFQEQILKHEQELLSLTQASNNSDLQQALNASQQRIEELEESLRSRSEVLEMLQQELNSADQQKQILTAQFRQMELELAEAQRLREEERQQSIMQTDEEMQALRTRLDASDNEKDQTINALNSELLKKTTELEKMRAKLEDEEREKVERLEKYREIETTFKTELADMQACFEARLERSESERNQTINALNSELLKKTTELEKMRAKLEDEEREKVERLEKYREIETTFKTELADMQACFEARLERSESERNQTINALNSELLKKTTEIDVLNRAKLEDEEREKNEVLEKLKERETELANMQSFLEARLEGSKNEREQTINALNAELLKKTTELDELRGKLAAEERERMETIQERQTSFETELANLRKCLEFAEKQKEEMTKKLEVEVASHVVELQHLQEKLNEVEREREEGSKSERDHLAQMQNELESLNERLDATKEDQEAGLQAKDVLEKLWRGIHSLMIVEEEEVEISTPTDPAQFLEVLPTLEARLGNLTAEQQESQTRMSQITLTLQCLQGQLDKSTAEEEEAVARIRELEQQLLTLQVAGESLGDHVTDLSVRDFDRAHQDGSGDASASQTDQTLFLEQQLADRERELSDLREKLLLTTDQTLKMSDLESNDIVSTGHIAGLHDNSTALYEVLEDTPEEEMTLVAVDTSALSISAGNESSPELIAPQLESPGESKGTSSDEMVTSSDSEVAHSSWTLLEAVNQDGPQEWPPQVQDFATLHLSTQSWEETCEEQVTSTSCIVDIQSPSLVIHETVQVRLGQQEGSLLNTDSGTGQDFAQILSEEIQKRYSELLGELQQLRESSFQSQDKVNQLEEELKSVKMNRNEAETRANICEKGLMEAKALIQEKKVDAQSVAQQFENLHEEVRYKDEKMQVLQVDLDEAQRRLVEQEGQARMLAAQLEDRELTSSKLEQKLLDMEGRLLQISQEADMNKASFTDRTAELEVLKKCLTQKDQEMMELNDSMTAKLLQAGEEKFAISNEVKKLKVQMSELERAWDEQQKSKDDKTAESEELIALRKEKEDMVVQMDALKKDGEQVKKKLQAALIQRKELMKKVAEFKKEAESREEKESDDNEGMTLQLKKEQEIQKLETLLQESREALNSKDETLVHLEQKIKNQEQALSESHAQIQHLTEQYVKMNEQQVLQADEDKKRLLSQITSMKSDFETLQRKLQEATDANEDAVVKDCHYLELMKQQKEEYGVLLKHFQTEEGEKSELLNRIKELEGLIESKTAGDEVVSVNVQGKLGSTLQNLEKTETNDWVQEDWVDFSSAATETQQQHKSGQQLPQIRDQDEIINAVQEEIKAEQADHVDLELRLQESQASQSNVEIKFQELCKELEGLREKERQIDALTKEMEALREKCQRAEAHTETLKEEVDEAWKAAKRSISDAESPIRALQSEVEEFQLFLKNKNDEIVDLSQQLSEQRSLLLKMQETVSEKDQQIASLQEGLKAEQDRIQKLEAEMPQREEEEKGNNGKLQQLQRKLQAALLSRKEALRENQALKEKHTAAEKVKLELQQKLEFVETELNKSREEKEKLIEEVDRTLLENQSLSASCESLKLAMEGVLNEKDAFKHQAESAKEEAKQMCKQLEEKVQNMKEEYETLLKSYENVSDEAERVRRVLEAARQERQELAAKARAHETARQEAERLAEEAMKEVDIMKEKMRKFAKVKHQKIMDLEEENERLREQEEKKGARHAETELKQALERIKEEFETLKANHNTVIDEKNSLEQHAEELRNLLAKEMDRKDSETLDASSIETLTEVRVITRQRSESQQYLGNTSSNLQLQPEESISALPDHEVTEVQANIEIISQAEERLRELETSLKTAECKIRELESALEDQKESRNKQESMLKSELASLKQQIQESLEREVIQKEENSKKESQLQNLRTSLEAERDDLEERLMNQLAQLNGSIAGYQQEAANSRDRLTDMQRELEKLEQERAELETEVTSERDRAARIEEDMRQAQQKRAEAEAEAGKQRELEQKLKSAQRFKEGCQNRTRQLEELLREKQLEVRQQQKDCIEYQERISELGKEVKSLLLGGNEVQGELKATHLEVAKIMQERTKVESELSECKRKLDMALEEVKQAQAGKLATEQKAKQQEADLKADAERTLDEVRYRLGAELKQMELRLEKAYREREKEEEATLEARSVTEAADRHAQKMQARLDEALARLAAFSRSMSSLQDDRDRVLDEAKQWESRFHRELQEKEADVRKAETHAKELAEQLQREMSQKDELQSLLERMQKAEENLQLQLDEVENKHSESLAGFEKEKEDLQQKLTQAENNLAQTRSQLTSLETEAEELRHRANALEDTVDKLQSENNEARTAIKERETEERRLCLRLEQLETDLGSSKNLTESLQAALDEKEKRELELLGEKEQAVTQAVEEARKDADERADMAEKELEERRVELRGLEERLRKAVENAFQSRAQLESFTKAMGSLQDDRDRVLSQYKQLEERHLQVMMEKDNLIQEAAGENNGLKEELRVLLSQRDDLNAENAKLAAQLHGYRNDLNQVLVMKDSQHKQILAAQVESISVLEREKEELKIHIQALETDLVQGKISPLEKENLSQASDGRVRVDNSDAPGKEVEKLREQLEAARKRITTLEETLELEREAQVAHGEEQKKLHWEGSVLRTEAETAEERVAELARDLLVMEQQLLEEREAAAQLRAQNQSFGQAMASLQAARDQAVSEAKELQLRLDEHNQTSRSPSPPSGSKGEVWSLKNALSALQNDRERMLEQLQWQRSELDRLGSGELAQLTQALEEERRRTGEREKIMAQMDRDKQELEMLRLERMDWQGQAELLKQQTLTTLSYRDQQVRQLTAMLEEARASKLRHEHPQRQGNLAVDAAPGGPLEHNEGYKSECIELQRRLDEEIEQRLRVEEQLIAAQDHLKRNALGEWQTASEAKMSETAVLIEPPEGAISRTRSGGPGLMRMMRVMFCSRQRTPLLVSLYLLTVHVLLLLCMGGYL